MTPQRAWQLRQREAGRCMACGKATERNPNGKPKVLCHAHYRAAYERQRAPWAKTVWCSNCQKPGHNKRTCRETAQMKGDRDD